MALELLRDSHGASLRQRLFGWLLRQRLALSLLAMTAVLLLVGLAVSHLARDVSYREVVAALAQTPWRLIAAAAGLAALSYAALTLYDLAGLAYVGRKLPYRLVALTSFCAYAVGNTAGFGPLTGGAIRFRFYAPLGLTPEEVAKVVGFITAAFGLGLAAITGLGLVVAASEVARPLGLPEGLLRASGLALLAGLLGLVLMVWRAGGALRLGAFSLRLPSLPLMAGQLAATCLEVSAAAAVLWVLLPANGISLPAFIPIFAVAIGLGVLSHVPGGLGVFETIIVAIAGQGLPLDRVLGALVLYRVIYYLLPLLLAALLVSAVELRRAAAGAAASRWLRGAARQTPPILATLVAVLGVMLIFSGVTETPEADLQRLAALVPLPLLEGAHFLASVLGLGLLVVARGLYHRLDGAWWAALAAAGLALVLSLAKALALYEAGLLALLVVALLASRREFTRPASLLNQPLTAQWLGAIAVVLASALVVLLFVYRDVEYGSELWWQFEFSAEAPRSLRALLATAIGAGLLAIWSLLRPAALPAGAASPGEMERALAILETQPEAQANLLRLGDKALLFSGDGRAFVMYGRQGRSFIALFDPVGPLDCWPELIWRFVEAARAAGGRAVFYQVAPEHLSLYADAGLSAYKIGEEALLDLTAFDLKGGKRSGLRQTLQRGQRDGLVFELLPPERLPEVIDELARISDAWLAHHKAREKSFSLGAFHRDYLMTQPVALLRREGAIVAFASLMATGLKQQVAIDLMRFDDQAPNGAVEFLFLKLIETFKDQGYRSLCLGMAPLSGLSESPAAPIWQRAGRVLYEHGGRFYGFKGLRAFKSKFQPQWQPRYLAAAGGINPALALADVTVLIGGGLKGVIGK